MTESVLVTGGAGYIGSHVIAVLGAAGRHCVSIDNYSNSSPQAVERVRKLVPGRMDAYNADICSSTQLREVFDRHRITTVIHLAGLKAVAESVEHPERYHRNNVDGTRTLLEALQGTPARTLVFSSSATVYGAAGKVPIDERSPLLPQSPYGECKLEVERMLSGLASRDPTWRIANLRYFNPVGAHPSGTIGENPVGVPNNLMPYLCQAAAGAIGALKVFGNDYPTPDGTGVRDYVHVMDLAEGHLAALDVLAHAPPGTEMTLNLGTGHGISVLELIDAFERVNGVQVPRTFAPRRPGDVAVCFADAGLAKQVLGWQAKRGVEDMCRDAWRWEMARKAILRV